MCKPWVFVAVYLFGAFATWGYEANKCDREERSAQHCVSFSFNDFSLAVLWPVNAPAQISKSLWRVHWFEDRNND